MVFQNFLRISTKQNKEAAAPLSSAHQGKGCMEKPLVFVSCGQSNAEEIQLGVAIADLIHRETDCEAYFAEQQNTLEGLVSHILASLGRAAGFIAVMHHRGEVRTPAGVVVRASIWVEQEIAIASFIQHVLQRNIEVVLYTQRGITREGIREQLRLKPIEFEQSEEVIEDLRTRIRTWTKLRGEIRPFEIGQVQTAKDRLALLNDQQKQMLHSILHQGRTDAKTLAHEYRISVDDVRSAMNEVDQTHLSVRDVESGRPHWSVNERFSDVLEDLLCAIYH
jgi:hypothetical protein